MKPPVYVTDERGRGGRYRTPPEGIATMPAPAQAVPADRFTIKEEGGELHLVDTKTNQSYGIAASRRVAELSLAALRRFAQ